MEESYASGTISTSGRTQPSEPLHIRHTTSPKGVKQWDRFYPNRFIIQSDLQNGSLFGVKQSNTVIAAVVVDEKQSSRYDIMDWTDRQGKPACVHRLAVHPEFQRRGLGKILLGFAEQYALDQSSPVSAWTYSLQMILPSGCMNRLVMSESERSGFLFAKSLTIVLKRYWGVEYHENDLQK
ncbi:GNAT family N-acetyltransferase [Paenibacillus alginolyticus]|uniref:GNAT family N-acetyltransferase n=1 Tax=Paenibacillus alginolyticus TaxID=59839 RepID=UPI001FEC988F|nr:GNAT family N-acetyltransferase [Paenibacillus frigoriresistens]